MRILSLLPVILFGVESTLSATTLNRQGRPANIVHEKRDNALGSWRIHKRLDKNTIIPFRIGLKQNNLESLEDFLMDVSDPSSSNYGQHWTPEKVVGTFKPSTESVDTVMKWLQESGIVVERMKLSRSQGWVEMKLTPEEAEGLLDTEYFMYEHVNGHKHIGCESYSLPVHVQPHVEIILPTVHFDVPKQRLGSNLHRRSKSDNIKTHIATLGQLAKGSSNSSSLANCDKQITPACLRALYNFEDRFLCSTKENSYAIAYLQSDLDMFFRNFSPSLVGSAPAFVSIDGGIDQLQDSSFSTNGESDLDLEYAMTLVAPQKVTLYQVGDLVEGGTFNNMLDAIDGSYCTFEGGDDANMDGVYPDPAPGGFNGPESCGIVKPANVISTSYGFSEIEASPEYVKRQCNEYGKLGLMGVTFLYSSGDAGVGGFEACIDPVTGMETPVGERFDPGGFDIGSVPLHIGATQINPGSTVHDPESACDTVGSSELSILFYAYPSGSCSGGGFSNVFELPSYQESAVTSFLKDHPPPYTAERYNNSGKIDGGFSLVYGTSLSSPVLGSMITAINDARILIGKRPVGFINPTVMFFVYLKSDCKFLRDFLALFATFLLCLERYYLW
ncbi:hypothetical protein Clacol_004273 [Clathrus columnatus]|uniref:Peptidase S53 domain-containing protein n=1 Tax=Clathrus columnatus TaxID=1419009 RepID=A0AAV5A934_9AGAM|nr:hypothetical protein Clacol_004273 [Clathrus columnatus]